jgi:hypothetical protein
MAGKHGWVQYFCKTALREATGLSHKNQQVFIVMNPIDLNMEPAILAVSRRTDSYGYKNLILNLNPFKTCQKYSLLKSFRRKLLGTAK